MLVTGSVVAASESTLHDLVAFVAGRDPDLASRLRVETGAGPVATCTSGWTSRTWVTHVTAFFESGRTQVLVGTRGLLGEGWNARGVSTLIDLTTATTLTAVVQTRGRALRTDPTWPDKVATNWTVVCVSEAHPKGDNDWSRLVRKHQGFHGIDADGDIVDGVAHIDASFSPFAPPPVASFDALNARMLVAAADRDAIRDAWKVGEPYQDVTLASLRVRRPTSRRRAARRGRHAHARPADVAADPGRHDDRRPGAGHQLAYVVGAGRGVCRCRRRLRSPSASGRSWPAPWAGSRPSARAR